MSRNLADAARTLERLRAETAREWEAKQESERQARARRTAATPHRRPSRVRRAAVLAARLALLVLLPFAVLVRVAVTGYASFGYPTWFALTVAAAATVAVVTVYAAWISQKLTGQARLAAVAKTVALPLVLGYALYALLYVSAANAKSDTVRAEYLRLHPVLRIAVSTLILAEGELLITDMGRVPADYPRMDLPVFDASRHLRQRDGYAHALDLRTTGRGAFRNGLTQLYFAVMGFETLRHEGTADHLHVELPSN